MSRSESIRQWLKANPGWHFASDVLDGLATPKEERASYVQLLWSMKRGGVVKTAGRRGSMRYTLGRPARKYVRKEP